MTEEKVAICVAGIFCPSQKKTYFGAVYQIFLFLNKDMQLNLMHATSIIQLSLNGLKKVNHCEGWLESNKKLIWGNSWRHF